ncbi:MAG: type II secretion system protein J [Phycisphaerae bacterium]
MATQPSGFILRSRRSAFTFIELMLAATITALVAVAGSTLIFATTNASLAVRDVRTINTAGNYALSRVGMAIRQARAIGQVTPTAVVLWTSDRNADDVVNLDEIAILSYIALDKRIVFEDVAPPPTGSLAAVPTATFTNVALAEALIGTATARSVTWADGVQTLAFTGYPSLVQTRLVEVRFTMGSGPSEAAFQTDASPRAPADYLFVAAANSAPPAGSTRKRRKLVSQWDGW